jgi:hypothetical protein
MIYDIEQKASGDTNGPLHAQTKPKRKRFNVLALIIVAACCVSAVNLIIGHTVHYAHYTESRSDRRTQRLSQKMDLQAPMMKAYLTSILTGKQPYPKKNAFKFAPGSLLLSAADTFQHCYVNMTTYGAHIPEGKSLLAAVSDEYNLIYRNIPKSSSSTGRHVIQDFLGGEDRRVKHDDLIAMVHDEGYDLISFVREPLNRFYSSYDEAFFRIGPWMGFGEIVADKPRVKKWYYENKWRVDKYPYLFEGMQSIFDFRKFYCPPEILTKGKGQKCNEVPSIDDGTLTKRFEKFVSDYDGLDPFDVHLHLQVSNLVFPGGEPIPLTRLYNATDAEKEWQRIAESKGLKIDDGDITHGRKITRRFNVDLVSDATKRKICKLLALDYCCLNIKLPEVCKSDSNDDPNGVYCKMRETDGKVTIEDWRE